MATQSASAPRLSLGALNALPRTELESHLAPIFENAPWISAAALDAAPFGSVTALHDAMMAALHQAETERIITFLNGHPRLKRKVSPDEVTSESVAEQAAAGLNSIAAQMGAELDRLNDLYYAKFGFPFILAVRFARPQTILAALRHRLERDAGAELSAALKEISAISWMRLLERVEPEIGGCVSVEVIDQSAGRPADGLDVVLVRIGEDGCRTEIDRGTVPADGRLALQAPAGLGGAGLGGAGLGGAGLGG
ncbi:MAG: 2-oxo-4-hydroxy-4-carboxy-5-ureidoimidazoline decarboxylase, partial [Alphaproteobacteria bacterium]|nr:2-oxo-4-hydroxy-4-carboxy-5-ureidoimidazoline decarboxylase [Alphaproteobacteria bacterium]